MGTRNITAVYIKGLAFKTSAGSRRHQILLNLKKADETSNDLWLLKAAALVALGLVAGGLVGSVWPLI